MSSSIHIWCWDSVTILIRPVIIIIVVVIIVNIIILNLFTKSFVIDIIINSLLFMLIIVPDYLHLYCHLHAQYPHLCPSNLHYLRHSYHCNCHNHKAFFIKDVTLLSSNVSMYVCALVQQKSADTFSKFSMTTSPLSTYISLSLLFMLLFYSVWVSITHDTCPGLQCNSYLTLLFTYLHHLRRKNLLISYTTVVVTLIFVCACVCVFSYYFLKTFSVF